MYIYIYICIQHVCIHIVCVTYAFRWGEPAESPAETSRREAATHFSYELLRCAAKHLSMC